MTTFVQNTIIVTVFLLFRIYTLYCQNLNKRVKTTIRTKIHPHLSYSPCKIILWNDIINDSLLVINNQLKSSAYQNSYSSNKIKTMILSLYHYWIWSNPFPLYYHKIIFRILIFIISWPTKIIGFSFETRKSKRWTSKEEIQVFPGRYGGAAFQTPKRLWISLIRGRV